MFVAPSTGEMIAGDWGEAGQAVGVTTVNRNVVESVAGQRSKSASTTHWMEPPGRSAVNCVSLVVPMTAGAAPLTETLSWYLVAPSTLLQTNVTGLATPVAPLAGEVSVGACPLHNFGVLKWLCAESTSGQPGREVRTYHSTAAPSGTEIVIDGDDVAEGTEPMFVGVAPLRPAKTEYDPVLVTAVHLSVTDPDETVAPSAGDTSEAATVEQFAVIVKLNDDTVLGEADVQVV
jgi:hypothetical protein